MNKSSHQYYMVWVYIIKICGQNIRGNGPLKRIPRIDTLILTENEVVTEINDMSVLSFA